MQFLDWLLLLILLAVAVWAGSVLLELLLVVLTLVFIGIGTVVLGIASAVAYPARRFGLWMFKPWKQEHRWCRECDGLGKVPADWHPIEDWQMPGRKWDECSECEGSGIKEDAC